MQHPIAHDRAVTESVEAVLRDGTWCDYHGGAIDELKEKLAAKFAQSHIRLCSSGTIATELALRGLRVGTGDEVILCGYDFPGNFRAVEAVGAKPVLIDLSAESWIPDVSQVVRAASQRTKAIIVSHLHGHNVPMRQLMEITAECKIAVIEDCCQAPGAMVDGRVAGSWGSCSTLSFGGSKLLTSGRGGAVLCNDARTAQRIAIYCERGNDAFALSQLQAAALLPQLLELDQWNAQRSQAIDRLQKHFCRRYPWLTCPNIASCSHSAFYKWPLLVDSSQLGLPVVEFRDLVIRSLLGNKIPCGAGFNGFHRRSSNRCRQVAELNNTARVSDATVLVQHHALLSDDVLENVQQAFDQIDKRSNENFSNER